MWHVITMVDIHELSPSYTGTMKATTWQTQWAVMAVNMQWTMLIQSHWSHWVISPNLRTVCRLQRTWLGQLAVSLSPAEPLICRFCMCGSHDSACTWLIDEICRQAFFATAIWNEINLHNNKCVQASFSSMCACYLVRSLMLIHFL